MASFWGVFPEAREGVPFSEKIIKIIDPVPRGTFLIAGPETDG